MIKVITKEEILQSSPTNLSIVQNNIKASSQDPNYLQLIEKKVFTIHISGAGIGIPKMEQINSIKIKEKSFPIMGIPSDSVHKYFLSLMVMEEDIGDIEIDYKDLSEERQKKLNQIL
jgi:hypothetical protein